MMKEVLFGLFFLFIAINCDAQINKTNKDGVLLPHIDFSFQWPTLDLAQRFGASNAIGVGLDYMTNKNWIFGGDWSLMFGNQVNEDVLSGLRGKDGNVLGNDLYFGEVSLKQRGMTASVYIGKLFSLFKSNTRSGIKVSIGTGFFQHNIKMQDDIGSLNQVLGDYKGGYDRLSRGIQINEFIGYQHLGKNRLMNFQIGMEFYQGFTKNIRAINYNTKTSETNLRNDFLYGLKASWYLPFYIGEKGEDLYY